MKLEYGVCDLLSTQRTVKGAYIQNHACTLPDLYKISAKISRNTLQFINLKPSMIPWNNWNVAYI